MRPVCRGSGQRAQEKHLRVTALVAAMTVLGVLRPQAGRLSRGAISVLQVHRSMTGRPLPTSSAAR